MSYNPGQVSPLDGLSFKKNIHSQAGSDQYQFPNNDNESTLYRGTNHSLLSFETIATTERLLDRLDLSLEDEKLLEQALAEEEEKKKTLSNNHVNAPTVSMPASGFLSLRNRNNIASQRVNPNNNQSIKFSEKEFIVKGTVSYSNVEQHFANKSRYSSVAEEDSDSDSDLNFSTMNNDIRTYKREHLLEGPHNIQNQFMYQNKDQYPYQHQNIQNQPSYNYLHQRSKSHSQQKNPYMNRNVVNFEKYRFNNPNYNREPQQHLQNFNPHTRQYEEANNSQNQKGNTKSTRMVPNTYIEGNRTVSSKSSFKDKLSKPNINSSLESENTPRSGIKEHHKSQPNNFSTPTESTSTGHSVSISESTDEPNPLYKTHKKKSSFSLKSLFRSPKANKGHTYLKSVESTGINSDIFIELEGSPKNSFNQEKRHRSPIGVPLKFSSRNLTQTKNQPKDIGHIRSFSDLNKSSVNTASLEDHQSITMNKSNSKESRRLSFDSGNHSKSMPPLLTPNNSNEESQIFESHYRSPISSSSEVQTAGSVLERGNFKVNDIENAINMRNEGRLEESTEKLRLTCLSGNRTAFLLYGLALRNGYGTAINHKESFYYIREASGIMSLEVEVFNLNIDPFELERNSSIPTVIIEPQVPAIYECGISYLKGYSVSSPDEVRGLKCLEKAASLGHLDSMCLCGTIWSKHSNVRKKNLARAAAWFRLAQKNGANLVGSEWIYKDKYLKDYRL